MRFTTGSRPRGGMNYLRLKPPMLVWVLLLLVAGSSRASDEASFWTVYRHGVGFAAGTTSGVGYSYTYNFKTRPTLSWVIGGAGLPEFQNVGTQLRISLAEGVRTRLLAHLGVGHFVTDSGRETTTMYGLGLGVSWVAWQTVAHTISVEQVLRESKSRPGTPTVSVGINYTLHFHL